MHTNARDLNFYFTNTMLNFTSFLHQYYAQFYKYSQLDVNSNFYSLRARALYSMH